MRLIFASTVYPGTASEIDALLLTESIRAFAGSLSQTPIWLLIPEQGSELSTAVKRTLLARHVTLIPYRVDCEVIRFPFAGDVLAAAFAESMARGTTDILAWLAANTVILQEPREFLLPDDKSLGFRPVHHTLIGSRYDEPLDRFWSAIYHACNVPVDRLFPMTTHVDATRVRPYFNAGIIITRPERHLLQAWRDRFLEVHQSRTFERFYRQDERYRVFLHQAILSGVILSTLATKEIQELPSRYNYPLHLWDSDMTGRRPSRLEELATFRHERFYENPRWAIHMPADPPLKRWIAKRLARPRKRHELTH